MSESARRRSRDTRFLAKDDFGSLLDVLSGQGYQVIGPTIDQGAIVYDQISSVDDLPRGWTDVQEPGRYRLARREDNAWFGFVVGPRSWKQYLFPPQTTVAEARRDGASGWEFRTPEEETPQYAFLGVRACELAAIAVQDRVFLEGPYVDPIYEARRAQALVIAVNCTGAASTCFCTSMDTGPRCTSGYDLALTETDAGFLVEVGSDRGAEILALLKTEEPTAQEEDSAEQARQQAVQQITRRLDTTDIRNLLIDNLEHPRWDDVAKRCLSCTNCTMVCPTCFCSSVDEFSDLSGEQVQRRRNWDSCFNIDFSYMSGGVIRDSVRSRYRQWLTHKLATWIDQYGTSGCVGCGRCITWCPVEIDLTQEVEAIRRQPS